MTGFDLPGISGFGGGGYQQDILKVLAEQGPRIQGPGKGRETPDIDGPGRSDAGSSFSGLLDSTLGRVQELQQDTQRQTRSLALGEGAELHDVMIAANKSETAFNLLLEVRNKLVDAWEKLSRSVM